MSSWKYDWGRKNAGLKVSIQGHKNDKKLKIQKKKKNPIFNVLFMIFCDIWCMWIKKNTLNSNKILMKAEFIEKIRILLSKARLRELLRLEPCTGD